MKLKHKGNGVEGGREGGGAIEVVRVKLLLRRAKRAGMCNAEYRSVKIQDNG